jgi:hypothetical protein
MHPLCTCLPSVRIPTAVKAGDTSQRGADCVTYVLTLESGIGLFWFHFLVKLNQERKRKKLRTNNELAKSASSTNTNTTTTAESINPTSATWHRYLAKNTTTTRCTSSLALTPSNIIQEIE